MYKIIIKYRPEYKTPMRIREADNLEEAYDKQDEVEQGFGSCLILNEEEYKEFLKLAIDEAIINGVIFFDDDELIHIKHD